MTVHAVSYHVIVCHIIHVMTNAMASHDIPLYGGARKMLKVLCRGMCNDMS